MNLMWYVCCWRGLRIYYGLRFYKHVISRSFSCLHSFYRLVLQPEVTFTVTSALSSGPSAIFTGMPQEPILTLGMDPPEGWLVESVRTRYDLDNIHLEEIESDVTAEFELEYLLLEGEWVGGISAAGGWVGGWVGGCCICCWRVSEWVGVSAVGRRVFWCSRGICCQAGGCNIWYWGGWGGWIGYMLLEGGWGICC